jgi:hypothetical protein
MDQSVTVRVKGDTHSATAELGTLSSGVSALEHRLTALEQAYIKSAAEGAAATHGVHAHGAAHAASRHHVEEHGNALERFAKGLNAFASHSRIAAIGLEQLGLEATAGAAKLAGLAEALELAAAAAPALLAIGTVIAVGSAAFGFLKEAVDDAARSERELITIGALLRNQGDEGWKEQAHAVDEYASSLARTSVFAKTDFLAGMQAMLTAGVSYNDMIRSQNAAMDLAVAKTISVADAEHELADAYDGRFRGLIKLGIITREEANAGIEYETILQRIEGRMSGTAAGALDTYSGKVENLKNLVGLVKEEFGTALLPVLGAFEDALRTGVDGMHPLSDEFKAWAKEHLPELRAGGDGFGKLLVGIAEHALPAVERGVEKAMNALAELGKAWSTDGDAAAGFADHLKRVARSFSDAKRDIDELKEALKPVAGLFNLTNDASSDAGKSLHDFAFQVDALQKPLRDSVFQVFVDEFRMLAEWIEKAVHALKEWNTLTTSHVLVSGAPAGIPVDPRLVNGANYGAPKPPTAEAGGGLLDQAISQAASQYAQAGVTASLLRAVGIAESNLGAALDASGRGDNGHGYGPFQLDDQRGRGMTGPGRPQELLDAVVADPFKAAGVAAKMLAAALAEAHGDLRTALAIYNVGPRGALHGLGFDYADKVLKSMDGNGPTLAAAAQLPSHREHAAHQQHHPEKPKTHRSTHFIEGPGSTPGGYNPGVIDEIKTDKIDPFVRSAKELKATLDAIARSEEIYAEHVRMATTSDQAAAATLVQKKALQRDAGLEIAILNGHIATELEMGPRLTAQLAQEDAARRALHARMIAQKEAIGDGSKATHEQLNEVRDTELAYRHAEATYARTNKYITENTDAIEANRQKVAALVPHLHDYDAAIRALDRQLADHAQQLSEQSAISGKSLVGEIAYYERQLAAARTGGADHYTEVVKWLNKIADARQTIAEAERSLVKTNADKNRSDADELATFGQSLEAQRAYFEQRLAALKKSDVDYYAEAASLHAKIKDLEKQAYESYYSRVEGYETTFMDGVLKKHQSLRQSVKDVFDQMLNDWVNHLEQMVLKSAMLNVLNSPSGPFGKLLQSLGLGAAIGVGAMGPAGAASGNPQLDAAITAHITAEQRAAATTATLSTAFTTATTATSTGATATNTATQALGAFTAALQTAAHAAATPRSGGPGAGVGGLDGLLGAGSGGSFNVGNGQGPWTDNSGTLIPPGWDPNNLSVDVQSVGGVTVPSGGALPTDVAKVGGSTSAASSLAGGAMSGLMIAQLVNGITGGNATWSSVGGAVGGAFFGPIGAAVGSAIGGQFGNHKLGPSFQPDMYNPAWGQADVDWNGAAGAQTFGDKQFTAANQYNVGAGGTPLYKLMEQWANSATATTDNQKALQAQIKALEAGNPNADLGVVRQADNIAYLANGKTIKVPDLIALEQQYATNVASGGLNASAVFQLTRSYLDFNIGSLTRTGTYTPTPITIPTGGTAGAGSIVGTGGGGDGGGTLVSVGQGGGPDIHFHIGTLIGSPDGLRDLANRISPLIGTNQGRQFRGLTARNPSGWGAPNRYSS